MSTIRSPLVAAALAALVLPAVFFLASCSGKGGGPQAQQGPPPRVIPVTVATAVRQTVPVQLRTFGAVDPIQTVTIKSLVGGEITEIFFKVGDEVKAGVPLFTIDRRPYETAQRLAQANLDRDTAQANQARLDEKRLGELLRRGAATQDEYDQARAKADSAVASVAADNAAIEAAKLQLNYCNITSPIAGRLGDLLVDRGNIIKANDVSLVTINQIQPIYVTFSLPEQYLAEIKKYRALGDLEVVATVPNATQPPETGKLVFIDNQVDRTTGTIHLKGFFENKQEGLWPGLFVNVALTLTKLKDVIVVPTQCVQNGQNGQFIYTVDSNGAAQVAEVTIGPTLDGKVAILSGVEAGQTVVTDGQLQLGPGTKVQIKTPTTAPASGPASGPASAPASGPAGGAR